MISKVEEAIAAGEYSRAAELEAQAWVDGPQRAPGPGPAGVRDAVKAWLLPTYQVSGWSRSQPLDPPAAGRPGEISAPTLVVTGALDAAVIRAGYRFTAAGVPGADLEVIADAAHLPNMERPDEFNTIVGDFLARFV